MTCNDIIINLVNKAFLVGYIKFRPQVLLKEAFIIPTVGAQNE